MNEKLIEVVFPLALRHPLTYRLPPALADIKPGSRVRVPLGRKETIGIYLKETQKSHLKLRNVDAALDEPPLLEDHGLKLLQWASAYYLTPIGEVLRHMVPKKFFETIKNPLDEDGRRAVKPSPDYSAFHEEKHHPLHREQAAALEKIIGQIEHPSHPLLLHGVTGSGKTEVYREAVRRVLEGEGQSLILVPEIGLTPQIVGRFATLGVEVCPYHSALTEAQRLRVWMKSKKGTVRVVIATRSGVFLPFKNLKLIVVDEEHDTSYKQEERFCYHARDLALWRADQEKLAAVLGSATPSLESLFRVSTGKLEKLSLSERPSGASMPEVVLIDRRRPEGADDDHPIFSKKLLEALDATLRRGDQSLLFLNRRGFAPFVLCPKCGHVPSCEQCDISLTLHRGPDNSPKLICHYCDASRPYHPVCDDCGQGAMTLKGFGTEKVAAEVSRLLPRARVERLDRDAMAGGGWLKVLDRFKKREVDILVGTQVITKGHDYPHLTLVGLLDADISLHLPDFRAAERTFQTAIQAAGRAGRSQTRGRVLVQTYHPEHESLQAAVAHDGHRFIASELKQRREAGYPPFNRLIEIRLAAQKAEIAKGKANELGRFIEKSLTPSAGTLLGPSACPIERVRGWSRWRLLIKTPQYTKIQPTLGRILDDFTENHLPSNMKMLVNVDPVDMV